MSLPSHEAARTWPGLTMVDRDGDTVGKITHIYLDRDSSQPEWALVAVPERGRVFVPLSGAGMQDDRVRVAVASAAVRDAPEVASGRELSEPDEARLYSHYGATAGQPDRGAMRAPSAGGRAKDAANRLNQRAGGGANRLQEAGGRARGVVTSPPAKRLLSAAGAASALGAAAAVVGRSRRPRRGGMAGMLDGLLAAPGAALQRRRRRRRVQAAGRLLGGAATAPLRALAEAGRRAPAPPRPLSRKRRSKMAGRFKLAVGLAAGYVLGARAGRERYERLVEMARQVADRPEVQQLTGKVRTGVGAGMDKAASAAAERLERARTSASAREEAAGSPEDGRMEAHEDAGSPDSFEAGALRQPPPASSPSRAASPVAGKRERSGTGR